MSKIKLTCDNCGEEMRRYKSHINEHNFCSNECKGEWKSHERVEIECDQCGKDFTKIKDKVNNLNFCSRECSAKWHRGERVELECDWCGGKFTKLKSKVRDNNFCSKKCNNKWISSRGNTEICDWCGEEFKMPPKEVKEHNFCCHEHYAKWLSENQRGKNHPNYDRKTINCSYCGKEFTRQKWLIEQGEGNFCSHECYAKSLKGSKILTYCRNCGEKLIRTPKRFLKYDNSFCSIECSHKWYSGANSPDWEGGYDPYYGDNYSRQREKTLERDNHECQICFTGEDLVIHHKIPVRAYKSEEKSNEEINWEEVNSLDNLVTLCRSCHSKLERGGFNNLTESNIKLEAV